MEEGVKGGGSTRAAFTPLLYPSSLVDPTRPKDPPSLKIRYL